MKYFCKGERIILILILIVVANTANTACSAENPLAGCTQCSAGSSLAISVGIMKNICTDITNCFSVYLNGSCASCTGDYYVTGSGSACTQSLGCINYDMILKCLQCQVNYILINGSCVNNTVKYCQTYDSISLACKQCIFTFMDPTNNCQVSSALCSNFDYTQFKCLLCPNTPVQTYLDMSSQYCLQDLPNCLLTFDKGCIKCQQQYDFAPDLITGNIICQFDASIDYDLIIDANARICTNKKLEFDTVTPSGCRPPVSLLNYCSQDDGAGNCIKCIAGFYLAVGKCYACNLAIQNCLFCSDISTCVSCEPTYLPFTQVVSGINKTTCRQCSIYGCKKCMTQNSSVFCIQCERGQTLFNYSCYNCSQGTRLNITNLECISCPINCSKCNQIGCTWCTQGFIILSNGACGNVSMLASTDLTSPTSIYELIVKAFPKNQQLFYKNSIQLMSSCQQSANLYTCLCSSINKTSLCYDVPTNISKFNFDSVSFGTPNATINSQAFLKYFQTLRLMAQVKLFDTRVFQVQKQTLIPQNKLASLLQIYTQILRRNSQVPTASTLSKNNRLLMTNVQVLTQLFNLATNSLSTTLSVTQTTVIYGNGYYFKYYPAGASVIDSDTAFVSLSSRNTSQISLIFIWFQNLITSKSLTGNIYIFTPSASHSETLVIKQMQFPSIIYTYNLYRDGAIVDGTQMVTKSSNNQLVIGNIMTSTAALPVMYSVVYAQSPITDIQQLYGSERIEFIFYQPAFIYVLVFLVAYLFLIPFCSLIDVISPKTAHRRKRIRSQDLSMSEQAKKQYEERQQSSSEHPIQIQVNYRDFFPIYNICNTPKPRRILKLCLFLLNVQHGITFLTLIYFNLAPGHPVLAVVLGLPAYFCTVIMGYICGFLTLKIPGVFKYSINLLVLGYWVLWIALMPRFLSQEYQPYVYIFAIVFFIIDLIIDLLEMYMMYFIIKQSERQIKMFRFLAAWLSKRGYYEFDKLARQMSES